MIKPNPSPATTDRTRHYARSLRPDRQASLATSAATTAPKARATTAAVIGEADGWPPSTRWVSLNAAPVAMAVTQALIARLLLTTAMSLLPGALRVSLCLHV